MKKSQPIEKQIKKEQAEEKPAGHTDDSRPPGPMKLRHLKQQQTTLRSKPDKKEVVSEQAPVKLSKDNFQSSADQDTNETEFGGDITKSDQQRQADQDSGTNEGPDENRQQQQQPPVVGTDNSQNLDRQQQDSGTYIGKNAPETSDGQQSMAASDREKEEAETSDKQPTKKDPDTEQDNASEPVRQQARNSDVAENSASKADSLQEKTSDKDGGPKSGRPQQLISSDMGKKINESREKNGSNGAGSRQDSAGKQKEAASSADSSDDTGEKDEVKSPVDGKPTDGKNTFYHDLESTLLDKIKNALDIANQVVAPGKTATGEEKDGQSEGAAPTGNEDVEEESEKSPDEMSDAVMSVRKIAKRFDPTNLSARSKSRTRSKSRRRESSGPVEGNEEPYAGSRSKSRSDSRRRESVEPLNRTEREETSMVRDQRRRLQARRRALSKAAREAATADGTEASTEGKKLDLEEVDVPVSDEEVEKDDQQHTGGRGKYQPSGISEWMKGTLAVAKDPIESDDATHQTSEERQDSPRQQEKKLVELADVAKKQSAKQDNQPAPKQKVEQDRSPVADKEQPEAKADLTQAAESKPKNPEGDGSKAQTKPEWLEKKDESKRSVNFATDSKTLIEKDSSSSNKKETEKTPANEAESTENEKDLARANRTESAKPAATITKKAQFNEPASDEKKIPIGTEEPKKPDERADNKSETTEPNVKQERKTHTKPRSTSRGVPKAVSAEEKAANFFENSDLKARRGKRKAPTGITTDSLNLPYSFLQKPKVTKDGLDLDDDSESNSFTLTDSLFRAPRAVKWGASIVAGLMVVMVATALQVRFLKTEIVPTAWIPKMAIAVVVILLGSLVVGSFTQGQFTRKARSDGRSTSATHKEMREKYVNAKKEAPKA